jgi:type VI secretion system secreted protein VgrG
MADPTQANRRIAITTPLGPDVLLVRRCSIHEQISRLFQIDLDLSSTRNDIDFDKIVGKNVTIRLDLPGQKKRFFNGFVNRFVQTKTERSYSAYRASVVPWLWLLTRSADCKIFQASMAEAPDPMTVPGIIKKVFKDHGFEDFKDEGLTKDYREWEFCVQYRETAFNFVSRLMEQEGISYFFTHEDGKHHLMLADSADSYPAFQNYETIPYHPHTQGATDEEAVTDWVVQKEVQPTTYILNDFNFEKPKLSSQKGLVVNSTISRTHENADLEIYDYPGEFLEHGEGEVVAQVRVEELQARHEIMHGQASAKGLAAGHKFKLKNHPRGDQNRECLITSVALQIEVGDFEAGTRTSGEQFFSCSFTGMEAAQPFRPPRVTPKPLIQGVQTAMVVGPAGETIHTDKFGRIKVHFHWDRHDPGDDNCSCWIRVSQPWGGKNWGGMFVPHVGQEVVVSFEEGDPDCPLITGRMYNPDQMPPLGLPDNKTKSVIRDHGGNETVMEGKDGSQFIHTQQTCGNELLMDGTSGKEKIEIRDKYGNEIVLDAVKGTIKIYSPTHESGLVLGESAKLFSTSDFWQEFDGAKFTKIAGPKHENIGGLSSKLIVGLKHETVIGLEAKCNLLAKYEFVRGIKVVNDKAKKFESIKEAATFVWDEIKTSAKLTKMMVETAYEVEAKNLSQLADSIELHGENTVKAIAKEASWQAQKMEIGAKLTIEGAKTTINSVLDVGKGLLSVKAPAGKSPKAPKKRKSSKLSAQDAKKKAARQAAKFARRANRR